MRILGIDLGTKRVGLAISDSLEIIANPYRVITYTDYNDLYNQIALVVEKENVKKIVLGMPKNMNGSIGEASLRSLDFQKYLSKLNLEIILVDERLSTKEAENVLLLNDTSRSKRKKVIDSLAATIILETYLNRKR